MKIKLLKIKNWLLLSITSLLALQVSCKEPDPPESLYGCPEVEYNERDSVINDTVVEP